LADHCPSQSSVCQRARDVGPGLRRGRAGVVGRVLLGLELGREDREPTVVEHGDDVIADQIGVDGPPRRPVDAGDERAVPVVMRLTPGPSQHVQHGRLGLRRPVVFVAQPDDLQVGDGVELLEVAGYGAARSFVGELDLREVRLELLEERRLVGTQIRLEPVLRMEEDLPVGFPQPVGLHPPPLIGVLGPQPCTLDPQQRPLHELLHAADRLLES
jgi:hypothetical protein